MPNINYLAIGGSTPFAARRRSQPSRCPQKEEHAKKRISDMYGYCQDNFFRASKNAVAKRLGEQPADIEKQKPNKQIVPTPSWLRGRKKEDDRDER